ncbi:UvrD-helicase domain-containing protein [Burkholderia multivorans]|uniref:UvrD-helicase domain-containing protein n=1 Tax=Burkholderia multivorans TaxID=87883 RepID=UPI0020191766|nr:ATP-dependent helicase [Burkholderia multivorans]MCO1367064.1 ATP-dependent helicase [Burkholderia multivorans]MCO1376673.1 ATP-dependent helicase [Burkholderia multivorans]UQP18625.1 ATP-dependent helicase [Burkholderia multivorans]UQP86594.1 ATP-dependent helicase [Burkholderia multivorans]
MFEPTEEQARIISHEGSAFVSACPGAGKTRVLIERARRLLADGTLGRGIAFLSFTTAAISELEDRLRREKLIQTPVFPHFIGTFDAFLWQFLIAPFGIPGCTERPRLIPDKRDKIVRPFHTAQELPLKCFDRMSGSGIAEELRLYRFDRNPAPYEAAARAIRAASLARGELDFDEARDIALSRLRDPVASNVLRSVFAARFRELIVDEAQDCNPVDLEIIRWFRDARISVKVICDPNQAIYGFRGGVTDELEAFSKTFQDRDCLPMTGNFRSSQHIAKAIVALRAPSMRKNPDEALGEHRDEPTHVHVLAYAGIGIPASIGIQFRQLTERLELDPRDCPVVSATRRTGAGALGRPALDESKELSCRLAMAVSRYHFSFGLGGSKEALEELHKIALELEGHTTGKTYHQHIADTAITPESWRPRMLQLAESLRFDPTRYESPEEWLEHARALLAPYLPAGVTQSINQRLRRSRDLAHALSAAPSIGHPAKTIHSVKGMEFPGVCVVISAKWAKQILDFLTGDGTTLSFEEARKIYVGASRAKRLLVIAIPKSQSGRFVTHLRSEGAGVSLSAL